MKKFLIPVIIIIVIVAVFFFIKSRKEKKKNGMEYETVEVTRGDIEVKVLSVGTIQPYTRVEVRSSVSGRVDSVEVEEGDHVEKRAVLAFISSEDRISLIDAALSALESAQRQNNKAAIAQARESYRVAQKAYKPVPLITSISGEVIDRSCEPGQNVSPDSVLFVLSDRLVAGVEVDEADIGKIEIGQEAVIVLDAFPDDNVPAKVTKISREGRTVSEVVIYDVMVEPLEVPDNWASGMTATVTFKVESRPDILQVPAGTVKEKGPVKLVFVLRGNKPEPVKVETGISDGKMVEIIEGLDQGDKVLTNYEDDTERDSRRGTRRMMRMVP